MSLTHSLNQNKIKCIEIFKTLKIRNISFCRRRFHFEVPLGHPSEAIGEVLEMRVTLRKEIRAKNRDFKIFLVTLAIKMDESEKLCGVRRGSRTEPQRHQQTESVPRNRR